MGKETSVQHSISGDRSGPVLMKPPHRELCSH